MDNMAKLQTGGFIKKNFRLTGFAKIVLVALFFIPATMPIGFFLLCSWYGGAIMVHLASEGSPLFPAIFLTSVWVSAYLMDPALFAAIQAIF